MFVDSVFTALDSQIFIVVIAPPLSLQKMFTIHFIIDYFTNMLREKWTIMWNITTKEIVKNTRVINFLYLEKWNWFSKPNKSLGWLWRTFTVTRRPTEMIREKKNILKVTYSLLRKNCGYMWSQIRLNYFWSISIKLNENLN